MEQIETQVLFLDLGDDGGEKHRHNKVGFSSSRAFNYIISSSSADAVGSVIVGSEMFKYPFFLSSERTVHQPDSNLIVDFCKQLKL